MNANERCFRTGNYSYDCNCNLCPHQKECDGSDINEETIEDNIDNKSNISSE